MIRLVLLFALLMTTANLWSQSCGPNCRHRHLSHRSMMEYPNEDNKRSDTLDIIRYTIDLDLTQSTSGIISASCAIEMVCLMEDVDILHLDLLGLQVDSVKMWDQLLSYEQDGEELYIQFPVALGTGDGAIVTVYYHGDPVTDQSWGGFYTTSTGFAYNIGVAFTANPHNFGRVWFPCFDNFVERSEYDVRVLTSNGRTAYCGGIRMSVDTVGTDSLYTRWLLEYHPIPTYLASVASAPYTHVEVDDDYLTGIGTEIPVWLTARPQDTTAMKSSFVNLIPCLAGFESRYGPYRWPRVGFVSVPFTGGAMEHSTNIAYPSFAIDGGLAYENLYAHELSHQWWGDLVTCRTPEDMWLNEGWATYSEALFEELLHGEPAYKEYVADNHKIVLTEAHIEDGGRYPVSGVPHELTYGYHVYLKGADMVHNLRGVMGDDSFFLACRNYLEAYQFSDASSEDLRDFFQSYTSADLTAFFDDWIFHEGFPEFRIEGQSSSFDGSAWEVNLVIRQFSHYAPELYSGVPLTVTCMDENYQTFEAPVIVSDEWTYVTLLSPFEPVHVILNRDQTINYAVLAEEKIIDDDGGNDFDYAEMDIDVNSLGSAESFWMRVENHWAAANEPIAIPFTEYVVSPDRWWLVQSDMPDDASVDATIRYYGDDGGNNYFDPLFVEAVDPYPVNEDDMVILYRTDASQPWTEWPAFEVNTQGSVLNWVGRIDITGIKPGQYTWAVRTGTINVQETTGNQTGLAMLQQHSGQWVVRCEEGPVELRDYSGRLIQSDMVRDTWNVDTAGLPAGVYFIRQGSAVIKVLHTL